LQFIKNTIRMRSVFLSAILILLAVLIPTSCRNVAEPPLPDDTDVFAPCISYPGTSSTLDIVTFNVEGFPKSGYNSVIMVASLLNAINADVYALQEVASKGGFDQLLKLMPGYSGIYYLMDNDVYNLAYIYRTSEVTIDGSVTRLLFPDSQYFPRPAFEIKIHHIPTNNYVYIINNHLKCCSGTANETSRRNASEMLKNYIDTNLPNDAVIVCGDLNDEIKGTSAYDNPFLNFIDDPADYKFADMGIAKGSQLWWSYPSYPSHIDHILISNELFSKVDTTVVFKAAPCYADYNTYISDHRPEGIRITGTK
jgi:endonuclease/exonuclease/phosphatase family metal-dependent hydrolase